MRCRRRRKARLEREAAQGVFPLVYTPKYHYIEQFIFKCPNVQLFSAVFILILLLPMQFFVILPTVWLEGYVRFQLVYKHLTKSILN